MTSSIPSSSNLSSLLSSLSTGNTSSTISTDSLLNDILTEQESLTNNNASPSTIVSLGTGSTSNDSTYDASGTVRGSGQNTQDTTDTSDAAATDPDPTSAASISNELAQLIKNNPQAVSFVTTQSMDQSLVNALM